MSQLEYKKYRPIEFVVGFVLQKLLNEKKSVVVC
jgi:hypothetical protein